jgi:hypothetical protein
MIIHARGMSVDPDLGVRRVGAGMTPVIAASRAFVAR